MSQGWTVAQRIVRDNQKTLLPREMPERMEEMLKFKAWELFAVAVEMEKIGERFYRTAGEATPSAEVKKLFNELAVWETHHQKTFSDMEKNIPEELLKNAFTVDSEELEMYLQTFLVNKVFRKNSEFDPEKVKKLSPVEALQAALAVEKDAVVFYATMKGFVPTPKEQAEVEKIVQEEVQHVQLLTSWVLKIGGKAEKS